MPKSSCTSFQRAREQHRGSAKCVGWGVSYAHAYTASPHVASASPRLQRTCPPPAVPTLGLGQAVAANPPAPHPPRAPRPPHPPPPRPPHPLLLVLPTPVLLVLPTVLLLVLPTVLLMLIIILGWRRARRRATKSPSWLGTLPTFSPRARMLGNVLRKTKKILAHNQDPMRGER